MKFWDASAILPLLLDEPQSDPVRQLLKEDNDMATWWGTTLEIMSAFARLRRERIITTQQEDELRSMLLALSSSWVEIQPSNDVRRAASQILLRHPLRAADSLQLAAALVWADLTPQGHGFICLDSRLHSAARGEGFEMQPLGSSNEK